MHILVDGQMEYSKNLHYHVNDVSTGKIASNYQQHLFLFV